MNHLKILAQEFNIELKDEQIYQFEKYYHLLIETNKVMNLTAITQKDEVITKHFLDSIALAGVYPDIMSNHIKILDLGTGAGFPGIPLKIAFPDLEITLMDSLNKRVKFLQSVIDELKLTNITSVHGRAEEMAKKSEYRQQYELCVSRAVANLSTLSEYCIPFVQVGGKFISYKSSEIEDEVKKGNKVICVLGGKLTTVKNIDLPGSDIKRSFVFIDKVKDTPKIYPRKPGTASKEPIR